MASLRDILANNIKKYRHERGVTQAKLAEKAGISTQFIAMIELSRQFPSPEVLDQIADALEIEAYQLFEVPLSPEAAMERLRRDIVLDIRQVFGEILEKTMDSKCK
jgi:transcriptional regulator with XRE-family HTH domain